MDQMSDSEFRTCLVNMLSFLDEWCAKHDIRYFLAYGTLLGAIRHKGFIPWDDDLDIMMPRSDYERFRSLFNREEAESRYRFVDIYNEPNYHLPFGKLIDNNTLLKEHTKGAMDLGVYIDIFPIDNLEGGKGDADTKLLLKKMKPYRDALNAKLIPLHKKRSLWRNIKSVAVSCVPISKAFIIKRIDRISKSFYNYQDSRTVGVIVFKLYPGREVLQSEWINGIVRKEFEGRLFNVPCGYDYILRKTYGNYMTPPPEKDRVRRHDFEAYVVKAS